MTGNERTNLVVVLIGMVFMDHDQRLTTLRVSVASCCFPFCRSSPRPTLSLPISCHSGYHVPLLAQTFTLSARLSVISASPTQCHPNEMVRGGSKSAEAMAANANGKRVEQRRTGLELFGFYFSLFYSRSRNHDQLTTGMKNKKKSRHTKEKLVIGSRLI
jgi:hypothetical protein